MQKTVFLDIETGPVDACTRQDEPTWIPDRHLLAATAGVTQKRGETAEELERRIRIDALEAWKKESLDPIGRAPAIGGRVYAIGVAINDAPPVVRFDVDNDECALIEWLDRQLVGATQIIGHNIKGFDAPFLAARCLVYNLVGGSTWAALRKVDRWGAGRHVVDTLELLPIVSYGGRPTGTGRLADWVAALDCEQPDSTSGAAVFDDLRAGRYAQIVDHCAADIVEVRSVYRKMYAE